jgi:hypothetical protein
MGGSGTGPESSQPADRVEPVDQVVAEIVLLGRLAARIKAEPVEFKYPGVPKA